jgi:uncharacterized protein YhaN
VNEATEELERLDKTKANLLLEAKEEDDSSMDRRIRIDERTIELRQEAREIALRLESGRDAASQSRLYELLGSHDDASLAALLGDKKAELERTEALRTELLDRRGRLAQELERQRREAEQEDRRLKLGELRSKLEQLSERYAIVALSDLLIAKTKAIFEEEKQPEVLQLASRYFNQITDGAYSRIVSPSDTKALLAETNDLRLLDSSFLSRGTQEQLYLSMRFALCEAASREHPLPLLLDDLFVHFDGERLSQVVPVLERLSQGRQVILFTCHGHVAEAVTSRLPSARLLTLEARGA